jgi:hypothetical protein
MYNTLTKNQAILETTEKQRDKLKEKHAEKDEILAAEGNILGG